jgi:hypothetical protein
MFIGFTPDLTPIKRDCGENTLKMSAISIEIGPISIEIAPIFNIINTYL